MPLPVLLLSSLETRKPDRTKHYLFEFDSTLRPVAWLLEAFSIMNCSGRYRSGTAGQMGRQVLHFVIMVDQLTASISIIAPDNSA
jgi:hypothetical protein